MMCHTMLQHGSQHIPWKYTDNPSYAIVYCAFCDLHTGKQHKMDRWMDGGFPFENYHPLFEY